MSVDFWNSLLHGIMLAHLAKNHCPLLQVGVEPRVSTGKCRNSTWGTVARGGQATIIRSRSHKIGDSTLSWCRPSPPFRQKFSQLRASLRLGSVMLLNATESRCDALIVLPNVDHVVHVLLPTFTFQRSTGIQNMLVMGEGNIGYGRSATCHVASKGCVRATVSERHKTVLPGRLHDAIGVINTVLATCILLAVFYASPMPCTPLDLLARSLETCFDFGDLLDCICAHVLALPHWRDSHLNHWQHTHILER
ncbi:hypothetical protein OG21DRAFT_665195 [Imleria badia]|nr:hypothetical protein OG21DRAFT_665195 [Imleria badia]